MMRAVKDLPAGYKVLRKIDLMKNRKELFLVNGVSLGLAAVMFLAMLPFVPLGQGFAVYADNPLMLLPLSVALIAYVFLHELVHGALIHYFSGRRARYGLSLAYACAYSDFHFAKKPYLAIALAPLAFWGVILLISQAFVPTEWAWSVYVLQMYNIAGSAGDIYVSFVISDMPEDILVLDDGAAMTVYAPERA